MYPPHVDDSDSNSDFGETSATQHDAHSRHANDEGDDMRDVPVATQRPLPKRKSAQVSEEEDEEEESERPRAKPVSKQQRQSAEDEEQRQQKPPSAKSRQQILQLPSSKEAASRSRTLEAAQSEESPWLYWCQQSTKIFSIPNKSIVVAGQGYVTLPGGPEQLGLLMTKGAEAVWKNVRFYETHVFVVRVRSPQDKESVLRWMLRLSVADADTSLAKGSRRFLVAVPNPLANAAADRWSAAPGCVDTALQEHLPKKERHKLSPTQLKWTQVRGHLTDMCHVVMPPKKERTRADDLEPEPEPEPEDEEGCAAAADDEPSPEIRFAAATAATKQKLFPSAKKVGSSAAAAGDDAVGSEETEIATRANDAAAARGGEKRELRFTLDDSNPKRRVPQAVHDAMSDLPAWAGSVTWTIAMKS